jgi:putative SOS response-associated peptidase YedK
MTLPNDAMARLFGAAPDNDLPEGANYNVCPTTRVHVVRAGPTGRRLSALRWGFLPSWYKSPTDGPLLINARAETLAEKPAFREAARSRRCLIPADGFYEWTRAGTARQPWYIRRRDGAALVMAGLWQGWARDGEVLETCAIVTCAANESIARLHHRMPVIVEPEDWPLWLGEAGHGAARLMRPASETVLEAWPVHPRVNANHASGPDLIEPWDGGA